MPLELPAVALDQAGDLALEISEQVETVLRLLAPLPPQQRLVMAWSMFDFTAEEIARELNTTPAAVRQSLHRARKAMKQQLKHRTGEVRHEQPAPE